MNHSYHIDIDYEEARAIFSNAAFYEFAAKIDFDGPAMNQEETQAKNHTPPPLDVSSIITSASRTCTCKHCDTIQQTQPTPMRGVSRTKLPSQQPPLIIKTSSETSSKSLHLIRTSQNRLVWTKPLQKRFLRAVEVYGLWTGKCFFYHYYLLLPYSSDSFFSATPRKVLDYMNSDSEIPGLKRTNVASHLQKHRKKILQQMDKQQPSDESSGDDEEEEYDEEMFIEAVTSNVSHNQPYRLA